MADLNLTQQIIQSHLLDGHMTPGAEIALSVDQTLCQDATGTLVMLELEAMNLDYAKTKLSAQYVDHNLIQEDYKNADDHLFLQSAATRFGLWFSRAGNGVSHPLHMEYFGAPGQILVGSDSHTCAGGALGMLAMGAGGLEVAMAIAGHPFYVTMPHVFGIELVGRLPDWVSAKDIILEMLRRHGVKGGAGRVFEYYGEGLKYLDIWDRHVIANMGAELGATGSVFPSDHITQDFLKWQGRESSWQALHATPQCHYDLQDKIDLSTLEPLIALPSSPGNVVPVHTVQGREVYQAYIGSSANPGFRDFAMAAEIMRGNEVSSTVSFDINPASRNILESLAADGHLATLIHVGARIHQAGCNGCIGMGQAPATGRNSLRTVPRNFPGRSGTKEDSVYLCSPETATAAAIMGVITDPRELNMSYPTIKKQSKKTVNQKMMQAPVAKEEALKTKLVKGPNIVTLPVLKSLPKNLQLTVLLKVGDNISTDEIMPAGARVLPYRSNIPKISAFVFDIIDDAYATRAAKWRDSGKQHAIIAGENYGQGSSREHAALAPRFLGLQLVIAKSFARIHWENLVNFGVIPLTFVTPVDYDDIAMNEAIIVEDILDKLKTNASFAVKLADKNKEIQVKHALSQRQIDIIAAGGLINWVKN